MRLSYTQPIPQTQRAATIAALSIRSFASLYAGDVSGDSRHLYCSPALLLYCSRAKPAPPSPFANRRTFIRCAHVASFTCPFYIGRFTFYIDLFSTYFFHSFSASSTFIPSVFSNSLTGDLAPPAFIT